MIALNLTKSGYGTYKEIMNQNVDSVLKQLQYNNFLVDYENTMYEINKES